MAEPLDAAFDGRRRHLLRRLRGPHSLGGVSSNRIFSFTVTGDTMCRATDKTYRLDTPWTPDFLEQFPGVDYPG